MNRNLRLRVGMVRTIVKVEMSEKGDVFPGKAGLKHEETLARELWNSGTECVPAALGIETGGSSL